MILRRSHWCVNLSFVDCKANLVFFFSLTSVHYKRPPQNLDVRQRQQPATAAVYLLLTKE